MTVLEILEVLHSAKSDLTLAYVSVVQGAPRIGMLFAESGGVGLWKVIGYGTTPARQEPEVERGLVLSFRNVRGDQGLCEGRRLMQSEEAD